MPEIKPPTQTVDPLVRLLAQVWTASAPLRSQVHEVEKRLDKLAAAAMVAEKTKAAIPKADDES
jgi:hypothetical protein